MDTEHKFVFKLFTTYDIWWDTNSTLEEKNEGTNY